MGPLRSRTHNEILIRQRIERAGRRLNWSIATSSDPIEMAINSYDEGKYGRD